MKLHSSVIEKLVSIFEMHGGHKNELRLKNVLSTVDLAQYDRQSTGESILVLSEDLEQAKTEIKS